MARFTGRTLNRQRGVNAAHALYREDGRFFHVLTRFPGALFDRCGYIVFPSEQAYRTCERLAIGQRTNVPDRRGISACPGYVRVK